MYLHEYLQTRSNYWTMNFQLQCIHMHPYVYIYYITLHIMYTHNITYASASYNLCPCVLVHCSNTIAGIRTIVMSGVTVNIMFFVQVPHLCSGKLANLVLTAKNAMTRRMTVLIVIFFWCMALVDRVCVFIVGLLAFLLEVAQANMEKRKAGFKPG